MSSLLTVVAFVLRHQPDSDALEHVQEIICNFLGPSRCLSLSQACSFGSLSLLDWIWKCRLFPTEQWSLHDFLHSDPHYSKYQFTQCMEVAIARGDLEMTKWLYGHFSGCNVLGWTKACERGWLPVMTFLLTNDAGRDRKITTGSKKRNMETSDEFEDEAEVCVGEGNFVNWSGVMWGASVKEHHGVRRWLENNVFEKAKQSDEERVHNNEHEIVKALNDGNDEDANALMPPGRCVLDYASQCSRLNLIEFMLDCGYIRRDRDCANSVIPILAGAGRLDLMQQVVLLHSPPAQDGSLSLHYWYKAMEKACGNGYLTMLQWLLEHPLGQHICAKLKRGRRFTALVCDAGYGFQTKIMQYLYEFSAVNEISDIKAVIEYENLLVEAVRDGHCATTKWLIEHVRFPEQTSYVIDNASRCGQLDILKLFHEMDSKRVEDVAQNDMNQSDQVTGWWSRAQDEAMRIAAECGRLDILQWLQKNRLAKCPASGMDSAAENGKLEVVQWLQTNGSEGCTTAAMDGAASQGHLNVVQWLQTHRCEGCTTKAMDMAASNGHLQVVQWLQSNREEGCTTLAMDQAALNGHLNVLKYLHSNRCEGCTDSALQYALERGHVKVADWLVANFPKNTRIHLAYVSRDTKNLFDVLLFMRKHVPIVMTPQFILNTKLKIGVSEETLDVIAWLTENYPDCYYR